MTHRRTAGSKAPGKACGEPNSSPQFQIAMYSRKSFLKQSAAAAMAALVLPRSLKAWSPYAMRPAGLQLFTLFGLIEQDVPGTLKKIREIGYSNIESAFSRLGGYYGQKPRAFARMVHDAGLQWKSHHVLGAPFKMPPNAKMPMGADGKPIEIKPIPTLTDSTQQLVDEAAEAGLPYLVCANIPLNSAADISRAIGVLGKAGEACKKAGIRFAYHNHEGEFHEVEGKVPYQELLRQLSPDILLMELDLAWASHAGQDPVAMFRQHPGRFPLWHVKDLNSEGKPVEVGAGTLDFKPIFEAAETAGLDYYFVEQDGAPKPMENIAHSYTAIKKILS